MQIIKSTEAPKIEEVLQLFPDSTDQTEDIKEHLCDCLDDFHESLSKMRHKIDQGSHNTSRLRK